MNNTKLSFKKFLESNSNQDDNFGMSDLWKDYIKDFKDLNNSDEKNRCNVLYIGKLTESAS